MSRVRVLLAMLSLSFGAEVVHAAPEWCEVLVAPEQVSRDETDGLIGYLGQLLESQVIGTAELLKLETALQQGTLINPISEAHAQVNSRLMVHREGLQQRIDQSQIDSTRLLEWLGAKLRERERVRDVRRETRDETLTPYRKMDFYRIDSGSFQMGEAGKFATVILTEAFDLMSTPVTQWQWSIIMGANPSWFKEGPESIVMKVSGQEIQMQPDHPVESVSWDMTQKFIEILNEKSDRGDPILARVIKGSQKGDRYRLPTEAEWEYVSKDRGRANGTFFFGSDGSELKKYSWYQANSNNRTHAVGELAPFVVDGAPFYDLLGNVFEWVQDRPGEIPFDCTVVNPTGSNLDEPFRVIRGGSRGSYPNGCRSAFRFDHPQKSPSNTIGFRLIRERKR